ncbi:MAG: hypothetical protein JSS03_09635 [Proteobacteria bacterium]|nr:hypothetical protein [Pseudomonadota bacterium]
MATVMPLFALMFSGLLAGAVAGPRATESRMSGPGAAEAPGTAAGDAAHRYWVDVVNGLRSSSEPRDWVLASWVIYFHDNSASDRLPLEFGRQAAGALLEKAGAAAPGDALVQAALASTPVYEYNDCDKRRCAIHFDALARLEPDNAAAWIPVVSSAVSRHDTAAADAALEHMAMATRFDDHEVEMALAFRKSLRRYPVPAEATRDFQGAVGSEAKQEHLAFEASESLSQFQALLSFGLPNLCDPAIVSGATNLRKAECAHVGRMLLGSGESEGWNYLCGTGLATSHDREIARLVEWQTRGVDDFARNSRPDSTIWLRDWFADLEVTHDRREAHLRSLVRQGIPVTPPRNWHPDPLSCQ